MDPEEKLLKIKYMSLFSFYVAYANSNVLIEFTRNESYKNIINSKYGEKCRKLTMGENNMAGCDE